MLGLTRGFVHAMELDKCIMIYVHHYGIRQSVFSALKVLWALSTYLLLPTPGNLWFFTNSILLPFPECHIIGIIQCIAFSDWFILLSNMYLSFLHVFLWLDNLFLFSSEYYSIVWMNHSLQGPFGCFQVLKILNKAALNIHMQVFLWI